MIIEWDGLEFDATELSKGVQSRLRRKRYETGTIDKLLATCPTDIPFINFGGGIGVVDCFQNRRMTQPRAHLSIEGNPNGCRMNQANRDHNRAAYTIINKALAYTPQVRFFIPDHRSEYIMDGAADSRFEDKGTVGQYMDVPTTTLADLLETYGFKECAICIDAEGAEYEFIENELPLIAKRCKWLLVEWHFDDGDEETIERAFKCKRMLKRHFALDMENSSSRFGVYYGAPPFAMRLRNLRDKVKALLGRAPR